MIKSALLAGFFWASANFLPASPTAIAHQTPALAAKAPFVLTMAPPAVRPLLVAAAPRRAALPRPRMNWELPLPDAVAASPDALRPEEEEFIARVNEERTSRGLNALILDPLLVRVARAHSREMCDKDYFDHHSPTPGLRSPMDRVLKSLKDAGNGNPDYLLVGENIYYCSVFNDTYNVAYGHQALMDSPGHRANILEPRFTKIGLGIYRNARGEFWVTEEFTRDSE